MPLVLSLAAAVVASLGASPKANRTSEPAHAPEPRQLAAYSENLPNALAKIAMVPVPGGALTIGGKQVEVKPFFIAATETTWDAFDAFTSSGPPSPPYDQTEFAPDAIARPSKGYIPPDMGWGHRGYPAMNLSFTSAEMFCRWLTSVTKKKYRLPTEAEWEWACRAASTAQWKPDKATVDKSAWYAENSEEVTHPVGTKLANPIGVFDMLGNVGEWATDMAGKAVLCGGAFHDPIASITPTMRRRWSPKWQEGDPQIPKSRWWLANGPFAGFRVVCEP